MLPKCKMKLNQHVQQKKQISHKQTTNKKVLDNIAVYQLMVLRQCWWHLVVYSIMWTGILKAAFQDAKSYKKKTPSCAHTAQTRARKSHFLMKKCSYRLLHTGQRLDVELPEEHTQSSQKFEKNWN